MSLFGSLFGNSITSNGSIAAQQQRMLSQMQALQGLQNAAFQGGLAGMGIPNPQSPFVGHYRSGLVDAANANGRGELIAKLKKAEPRKIDAPGPRVPDAVVPITAWRAWSVRQDQEENLELWALSANEKWPAKKQMEAKCAQHCAPRKHCSCGLWAFRSVDDLMLEVSGYSVTVIGQVALWGRVIECSNGWRAQYGYPTELWLFDPSLEQLGYTYGVPVRTA